ncbi:MAG: hypothetical protein A2054_03645 [Deltaproteobacteria bacterium GWA2_55_10]|nr:MAG: hypothetical protein A2054_03645 [Deltaproteobacteria bacterium GWA2_55_10]
MSLIHQALKKLEGERAHSVPRTEYGFRGGAHSIRKAALIIPIAIGIAAAIYFAAPSNKTPQPVNPETTAVKPRLSSIQAKPSAAELNQKGLIVFAQGRYDEAATFFREASAVEPNGAHLYNNMGLAMMRRGDRVGAEAAFKKALELKGSYPEAMNNLAVLLMDSNDLKKAQALLNDAIIADPGYADAVFNLAVLLERKGDIEAAIIHYESFINKGGDAETVLQVKKKVMALRASLILKNARGG